MTTSGMGGNAAQAELEEVKEAVLGLEADRDNLRQAVRKLKVRLGQEDRLHCWDCLYGLE